jgi:hypothetical protein
VYTESWSVVDGYEHCSPVSIIFLIVLIYIGLIPFAHRPGTDWTSWITFAVSGLMQATLLTMCIVWTFRQRRLGIDEFGNPLDGNPAHAHRAPAGDDIDVPGLVTTEEEDPTMMRIALAGALQSAVEEEVRTGEVAVNEATPLLNNQDDARTKGFWERIFG